jgi:uncharacterized membrane protein YfcA
VPYLQAIGLEKEEFVQALGLSFTVSTVALAINVAAEGGVRVSMAGTTIAALALACVGMWIGQAVRLRMSLVAFRRWFFSGLLLLGLCLVARSVIPFQACYLGWQESLQNLARLVEPEIPN